MDVLPRKDYSARELGMGLFEIGQSLTVAKLCRILRNISAVTRASSVVPFMGHNRNTVPTVGFGPFHHGSRKKETALVTASSDESASTLTAFCRMDRKCKQW